VLKIFAARSTSKNVVGNGNSMNISRRGALVAFAGACASISSVARAQTSSGPHVIFDGQLRNGWQNNSWAKVDLGSSFGGAPAIQVEGAAWSALQFHHADFSTKGFSKVVVKINGGKTGGQKLALIASTDKKPFAPNKTLPELVANQWQTFEVDISAIGVVDTTIENLSLQALQDTQPYYVASIVLV
jgi:hypothetical protein